MESSGDLRGRIPGRTAEQEVVPDDKLHRSMGSKVPLESGDTEETIQEIIQSHENHKRYLVRSYTLLQPAQGIYRVEAHVEDSPVYEFIVDVPRKKVMYKFMSSS